MGRWAQRRRRGGRQGPEAPPLLLSVGVSDIYDGQIFLIFDRPISFDTEAAVDGSFLVNGVQPEYINDLFPLLPPGWIALGNDTTPPVLGAPWTLTASPSYIDPPCNFPRSGVITVVPNTIVAVPVTAPNRVALGLLHDVAVALGAIAPSTVTIGGQFPTAITSAGSGLVELAVPQADATGLSFVCYNQPSWIPSPLVLPCNGLVG